jgi:hypothetical protein
MNDFIRPIGPVERDIDPVYRVERATDEEPKQQQEREPPPKKQAPAQTQEDVEPHEGDDGHLHVDIRA